MDHISFYSGSRYVCNNGHEAYNHSDFYYPNTGIINGAVQQGMWPASTQSVSQYSLTPPAIHTPSFVPSAPLNYGSSTFEPAFVAHSQASLPAPLNYGSSTFTPAIVAQASLPAPHNFPDVNPYTTTYGTQSGMMAENHFGFEAVTSPAQYYTQEYPGYAPPPPYTQSVMAGPHYESQQPMSHNIAPTQAVPQAPVTAYHAEQYAAQTADAAVPETPPYNIRWVPASTPSEGAFKVPTAHQATKQTTPKKKLAGKPTKGVKKPRHKVAVSDGINSRVHNFRSCVRLLKAPCFWEGCGEIVWTDKDSIQKHMLRAHGIPWIDGNRVDCQWTDCEKNLSIGSLFRHLTNTHMGAICADCEYCGASFSRIDGRNRHQRRCKRRPGSSRLLAPF